MLGIVLAVNRCVEGSSPSLAILKHPNTVRRKDMGQKITIVDDIDGTTDAVGDLTFFVDGQEYSVDLNEEHMEYYKGLIAQHRAELLELADYGRPLRRQAPVSAPRGRTKDQDRKSTRLNSSHLVI